jgi:hypothetical protein
MKRVVLALIFTILAAPALLAQDHGEAGIYADYFRLQNTSTNFAGVGARLSINAIHHIALEAEMNYDFNRGINEPFNNGISTSFDRSGIRILHGLFGPKFQIGKTARLFVTAKAGFINFGFSNTNPGPGFTSQINGLRTDNVMATVYPGGGAEVFLGPIGLRLDAGDEIYFRGGAQNNFRLTFGPHIRF